VVGIASPPVAVAQLIPISMQRVSECESVVFCEAAASPQGWPPPKPLSIQKVFDCKWYKPPDGSAGKNISLCPRCLNPVQPLQLTQTPP